METEPQNDFAKEEVKQRERLITVLKSLEDLTQKQVSYKYIFLRGAVYGLGTVIGATILLSLTSYFFVQLFGTSFEDIQSQATELEP